LGRAGVVSFHQEADTSLRLVHLVLDHLEQTRVAQAEALRSRGNVGQVTTQEM